MKIVSPDAGVWRVGRTPDPIEFPEPPKADELDHSRAGNRFDSPTENFRVCYFATDLEACFGETLARFRPDPALIAAADEDGFMPAGEVPADWRNQRIAVQAEFMPSVLMPELRFLDVEALSTRRPWQLWQSGRDRRSAAHYEPYSDARRRPGFVLQFSLVEINSSARRHGVADEDIEHATQNAMSIDDQDDDTRLYLGPARNAELLEVVTLVREDGSELAIHAMKMREKYRRLLPGE